MPELAHLPSSPPQPSEPRPPFGLPKGSVRALLTLLIMAVVIVELARGQEVEDKHGFGFKQKWAEEALDW